MSELSREGHRQRLKHTYLENGIAGMADANILELILFYAIPRKDTKQLAYDILNHFNGRLDLVFSADVDELRSIKGVGDSAAILLSLFNAVSRHLTAQKNREVSCLADYNDAKAYCRNLLSGLDEERLLMITLDNNMNIVNVHTVTHGSVNTVSVEPRRIVEYTLRDKSAVIIVSHNHPHSDYMPSEKDVAITRRLIHLLAPLGIRLADHIIVGENGTLAMKHDIRFAELFD